MNEPSEANPRSPALQDFLDLTFQGFEAGIESAPASAEVIRHIFTRVDRVSMPASDIVPARLPACDHIAPVLADAAQKHPALANLAHALADLSPRLAWKRRAGSERQPDHFSQNHANATILGPGGLEERDDVWIGVSVMAPGTQYPDHSHPPEEVYLSLSGGEWRQNQERWHAPGPGGLVHNPPGVVHSMRSGAAPLLAVWCLLTAPRPADDAVRPGRPS